MKRNWFDAGLLRFAHFLSDAAHRIVNPIYLRDARLMRAREDEMLRKSLGLSGKTFAEGAAKWTEETQGDDVFPVEIPRGFREGAKL